MLFNSAVFLKFFAAFLLLYWLVRGNLTARNALIVAGSYLFYGWWNYKFLSLILISTLLDFSVGLALGGTRSPSRRRLLLAFSMAGNLGILGFFKYYNFFVDSLTAAMTRAGLDLNPWTLHIILPVGISFYTFQTLSYSFDVYRREIQPTKALLGFMAFVSFFPQLVAGPIERARHLLPQFQHPLLITLPKVEEGLWLIIWGLFKKIAVADNLAPLVELVFDQPIAAGPIILLATLAFGFQIYCDFSGYSDIARGLALLLGFDIMVNFNHPYAAPNLRSFWHRWHISLSTWLRDYLYISLGGNRKGPWRTKINLVLTMVLGGLWHGAAWNFVLWGLYHGLSLAICQAWRDSRKSSALPPTRVKNLAAWGGTMICVFYGWLFFRAASPEQIMNLSANIFAWRIPPYAGLYVLGLLVFLTPMIFVDAWQIHSKNRLVVLSQPTWRKALIQGVLLATIIYHWNTANTPFIYFNF